jgi:hypothetical protein
MAVSSYKTLQWVGRGDLPPQFAQIRGPLLLFGVWLMVNAVASAVYHWRSIYLYRMVDNLSLQGAIYCLIHATLARSPAGLGLGPHQRWVVWLLRLNYLQCIAVFAWYPVDPYWTEQLQAVSVVWLGCSSLYWSRHEVPVRGEDSQWRWGRMAGLAVVASCCYSIEQFYCHALTMYLHGMFHITLAMAVYILVTLILPDHRGSDLTPQTDHDQQMFQPRYQLGLKRHGASL